MTVDAGFHRLWPTPIGVHRYTDAATLNPLLVRAFAAGREAQEKQRGEQRALFFASDDDLLHRVKIPEWQDFVRFVVDSLGETAKNANREAWAGRELELKVAIEGMWSSAYSVQIDEPGAAGVAPRLRHGERRDPALPDRTSRPWAAPSSTSATPTCSRRTSTPRAQDSIAI